MLQKPPPTSCHCRNRRHAPPPRHSHRRCPKVPPFALASRVSRLVVRYRWLITTALAGTAIHAAYRHGRRYGGLLPTIHCHTSPPRRHRSLTCWLSLKTELGLPGSIQNFEQYKVRYEYTVPCRAAGWRCTRDASRERKRNKYKCARVLL